jgi:branched-chain amino acid transport system permease protein
MIGIILETGNLAILGARRVSFPALIQSTTYDLGGVFVTNKKIMIVVVSIALMYAYVCSSSVRAQDPVGNGHASDGL